MKSVKSKPVRIPTDVYKRLQDHAQHMDMTYGETLEECLNILDKIYLKEVQYAVGERLYTDIAKARGEAITQAISAGQKPKLPEIVVSIGKDTGE
jgi:predicted alternative tryptophan synthase beta-subunit